MTFPNGQAALFTESITGHEIDEGEAAAAPRRSARFWLTAVRGVTEDLVANRSLILRVFLPFVAGYYLAYLFRTINAVIAAPLAMELGLGARDLGLLTSVYFLTFAAAQLPIGILLDRYGPRRIQSALLVVAAVGSALFAASDHFLLLLAGRALIGLGVAAALTAGLKALVLWFPRDRVPLLNGLMVMLGALGAVTATLPADLLLVWIGWRELFGLFAALTAGCAVMVYLVVPEATPIASGAVSAGLRRICADPRFWRLAPLSATCIGTAWALQGLWAAQWLIDVERLDRAGVVQHLFAMAVALSFGALLLGVVAVRLRRRGIGPETLLSVVAAVFIAAQLALILRLPLPSYFLWAVVAAVGAAIVLSYAILAEYFPKELAGRANGALNLFHIAAAFVVQYATGVVLQHWTPQAGHYPEIAYQIAFALNLALQIAAWVWFALPRVQPSCGGKGPRDSAVAIRLRWSVEAYPPMRPHALISMMGRSTTSSSQRSDKFMQDHLRQLDENFPATHGRTVHLGSNSVRTMLYRRVRFTPTSRHHQRGWLCPISAARSGYRCLSQSSVYAAMSQRS